MIDERRQPGEPSAMVAPGLSVESHNRRLKSALNNHELYRHWDNAFHGRQRAKPAAGGALFFVKPHASGAFTIGRRRGCSLDSVIRSAAAAFSTEFDELV